MSCALASARRPAWASRCWRGSSTAAISRRRGTVAGAYRPRFLLISQLLVGTVVLAPLAWSAGLPAFEVDIALLIALSALGSACGNFLIVVANRGGEASLIAPLVYSQLISATVIGVLVFGDWPDVWSLAGLAVIAISGLGSLAVVRRAGLQ